MLEGIGTTKSNRNYYADHIRDNASIPKIFRPFFKTLFVFAKNEGHPVRESWLPALPALERASALAILGKPVEEQKNPPPALNSLLESLRVWLNSETELRC